MRRGYIRLDKAGPAREAQEAALRAAGLDDFGQDGPVYLDPAPPKRPKPGAIALPARAEAILSLRPGDELVIHSAGRLGATRDDALAALAQVTAQDAAVWDCEAGLAVRYHPDAQAAAEFAARAERQGKRERAARARQGITIRPGRNVVLTGKLKQEAQGLWTNPETTARQVADAVKVSERTLYRMFGAKGTPRFGRRVQK